MKPISFRCRESLPLAPEDIARQILDPARWPEFDGYGPIPGIKLAEFEIRTPAVVGTRIRVSNRDGSSHVEEIVEWQPDRRVRLRMADFSRPLSRLASAFEETWEFERDRGRTRVVRSLNLHAKSVLSWIALRVISLFLKKAIARHLRNMALAA